MEKLSTVRINNQDLQEKYYKGQKVVTFKDVDIVHRRPNGTASRNFRKNKNHFIEGVDYFLVKPSDIQKDEIRPSEINNRGTIFLTESGYLMVVKSFTDDLSWTVQRMLVNNYFKTKDSESLTNSDLNSDTADDFFPMAKIHPKYLSKEQARNITTYSKEYARCFIRKTFFGVTLVDLRELTMLTGIVYPLAYKFVAEHIKEQKEFDNFCQRKLIQREALNEADMKYIRTQMFFNIKDRFIKYFEQENRDCIPKNYKSRIFITPTGFKTLAKKYNINVDHLFPPLYQEIDTQEQSKLNATNGTNTETTSAQNNNENRKKNNQPTLIPTQAVANPMVVDREITSVPDITTASTKPKNTLPLDINYNNLITDYKLYKPYLLTNYTNKIEVEYPSIDEVIKTLQILSKLRNVYVSKCFTDDLNSTQSAIHMCRVDMHNDIISVLGDYISFFADKDIVAYQEARNKKLKADWNAYIDQQSKDQ